jgi:hypothetical protein
MRELWVVGGAAVVLLYDARETTKDVDAFSLDPGMAQVLRTAAAEVADRLGLPADWLNDGTKSYVHVLHAHNPGYDRTIVDAQYADGTALYEHSPQ